MKTTITIEKQWLETLAKLVEEASVSTNPLKVTELIGFASSAKTLLALNNNEDRILDDEASELESEDKPSEEYPLGGILEPYDIYGNR